MGGWSHFWDLIFNTPVSGPSNVITVTSPGDQSNQQGTVTPPGWMTDAPSVTSLNAIDPATTATFFNQPSAFVSGGNPTVDPRPSGYSSATALLNYTAYAQFVADVTNANYVEAGITYTPQGPINNTVFQWLRFDIESWVQTPAVESADPQTYLGLFITLAHQNGYHVMVTPARDLASTDTAHPKKSGESDDAWFLRTNIPAASAAADIFSVQDQANQGTPEFVSFFNQSVSQARAVNPAVSMWCGISTTHGTGAVMYAAAASVTAANGFWINVIGDTTDSLIFMHDWLNGPALQIVASDTAPTQVLTYTAVGLPTGMTMNSATGLITIGTVTAAPGSYAVTVTVTDPTGASGKASFTWTITPAPSNTPLLAVSITPFGGVDEFGNPYLAGITSYQQPGGDYSNLSGGTVDVGNIDAPSGSTPGSLFNAGPQPQGGISIVSGMAGPSDQEVHIDLISQENNTNSSVSAVVIGAGPASGGFDAVDGSRLQVVDGDILCLNAIHRLTPGGGSFRESPNLMNAEGYQNGWTDSGSGPRGAYELIPGIPNAMFLYGDLTGGTLTDGTTIVTLPPFYRPSTPWIITVTIPQTAATAQMRLHLGTNGQLQCFGMSGLSAGPRVCFSQIIQLAAT